MTCIDVTTIDSLEIVIDEDGTKVWVNNQNGFCVARWYGIKKLIVEDRRKRKGDVT